MNLKDKKLQVHTWEVIRGQTGTATTRVLPTSKLVSLLLTRVCLPFATLTILITVSLCPAPDRPLSNSAAFSISWPYREMLNFFPRITYSSLDTLEAEKKLTNYFLLLCFLLN